MRNLLLLLLIGIAGRAMAVTADLAFGVTADSNNTPNTVVYRDASGNTSVSTTDLSASTGTFTKAVLIGSPVPATAVPLAFNMNFLGLNSGPASPNTGAIFRVSSGAYTGNLGEGLLEIGPSGNQFAFDTYRAQAQGGGLSNGFNWRNFVSSGTIASPLSVGPGGLLWALSMRVHDGTAYRSVASENYLVYTATAAGSMPTRIRWDTASFGSTTGTEKLRLSSFGGLSVNTAAEPTAQLDVKMSGDSNSTAMAVSVSSQNAANILSVTAAGVLTLKPDADNTGIVLRETDNGNDALTMKATSASGFVQIYAAGATKIYFDSNPGVGNYFNNGGNFGIGTAAACSTCTLHVVGTGNFTGELRQGGVVSCATGVQTDADGKFSACVASDFSLKRGIKTLDYSGGIDALRPVAYRWKDVSARDSREHIGFIAQDVQRVYPAAVVDAGRGLLGIDPNALIAELVLEVQALRKRVAKLEK